MKKLLLNIALVLALVVSVSCRETKEGAENASDAVENAAEEAGEAIEDAAEEAEEALEDLSLIHI